MKGTVYIKAQLVVAGKVFTIAKTTNDYLEIAMYSQGDYSGLTAINIHELHASDLSMTMMNNEAYINVGAVFIGPISDAEALVIDSVITATPLTVASVLVQKTATIH